MGKDENKLVKRKNSIFIKIKTFLFDLFEYKKEVAVEKENEIRYVTRSKLRPFRYHPYLVREEVIW